MVNKSSIAKLFKTLELDDKDLIMFTITNLDMEKRSQQVHMVLTLKRKVQTEMLTTYLPTMLLLAITYATTFFKPIYFEASLSVNLTIMLVMTTIFTSKIEELPPTSDTKMLDLWLIFCLLVPFAFTLVQTAIECYREEEVIDTEPSFAPVEVANDKNSGIGVKALRAWKKKMMRRPGSGKILQILELAGFTFYIAFFTFYISYTFQSIKFFPSYQHWPALFTPHLHFSSILKLFRRMILDRL